MYVKVVWEHWGGYDTGKGVKFRSVFQKKWCNLMPLKEIIIIIIILSKLLSYKQKQLCDVKNKKNSRQGTMPTLTLAL